MLDLLLIINNGDYLPLEELAEDGAGVLAGLPQEGDFSIVLEGRGIGKRSTHIHLGGREGGGEEGGKAGRHKSLLLVCIQEIRRLPLISGWLSL